MSVVCIRANHARTLLFLFAATFLSPLLHIHAQPQCGGTTTIQVGCEGYGNTQAEAWANFMACVQNQLLTATQHGCQGKCPQVGFACRPMTIQFPPQLATYVQPQSGFSHGYFYTGPVTATCGCMPDLCGNLITVPGNGYVIQAEGCGPEATRASNMARWNVLKLAHSFISAICSKQTCRAPQQTCKEPINYVNEASVLQYLLNGLLPTPTFSSPKPGPGGWVCVTATLTIKQFRCRCSQ